MKITSERNNLKCQQANEYNINSLIVVHRRKFSELQQQHFITAKACLFYFAIKIKKADVLLSLNISVLSKCCANVVIRYTSMCDG